MRTYVQSGQYHIIVESRIRLTSYQSQASSKAYFYDIDRLILKFINWYKKYYITLS